MKRVLLPAVMLACLAAVCVSAQKGQGTEGSKGQFDYYLLSLSWAPNYCAGHPGDHSAECRASQHANFVLHGLWPQANSGNSPVNCGKVSPVSSAMARHMLEYFPSRGLIQHEWSAHGSCSGLSAADYFAKVEQAIDAIKIPDQYRDLDHRQNLSVKDLEKAFASANNAPPGAFRVSCHNGALVNLEACLSKDLKYLDCTASVRECPAAQVLMRPVK